MRRDNPNDPEAVVTKNEPEPGTPEWVRMRQEQTFKPAETRTRQFQPHRQDGRRSGVTRQKQPGVFWATLALFNVILHIKLGPYGYADSLTRVGSVAWWSFLMTLSCGLLLSWVSQSLRWLKDK